MKKAIFTVGVICVVSAFVAVSSAIVNNVREGSNSLNGALNWRSFASRDAHPRRNFERYHLDLPSQYTVIRNFDSTECVKQLPRVVVGERVDPYFDYRRENFINSHRTDRISQGWWRLFE